jgi:hypothetical protein
LDQWQTLVCRLRQQKKIKRAERVKACGLETPPIRIAGGNPVAPTLIIKHLWIIFISAFLYSFFGTCARNNVNPYLWLKKVLEMISDHPINKIEEFLPANKALFGS